MNRLVSIAGVIAAAALAAGCSSSGGSTGSGSGTGSSATATSSASAGSGANSGATAAATTPATSTTTATNGAGASSTPSCATSDLKVTIGSTEGAAGSVYLTLDFKNVSGSACTLYGYPGVSLAAGTSQVSPGAARSTASSKKLVTLAPGSIANAVLQVGEAGNYPASTCAPKPATDLKIYPPNQTVATYVSYSTTACTKSVHQLTIGTIQAG